jgi:ABC-type iron transport system FetAB permease component
MWRRLSSWGRVRMVVLMVIWTFMVALAFSTGDQLRGSAFLSMPLMLLVETWGEQNRSRRDLRYWLVSGFLTAAVAVLLALLFLSLS